MTVSKSPDRHTFQRDSFLKRKSEEGKTPENDQEVADMVDYYQQIITEHKNKPIDEDWKKNNLEYDLRSTAWILEKTRRNPVYAQNLYAALCNNDFVKNEVWPLLKEESWSCSWRHAGGIIADMREYGDYIDWYCSGIRNTHDFDDGYVAESVITEEIRNDLLSLGWIALELNT